MTKLRITTRRKPWVNGAPQLLDAVVDADAETRDRLLAAGMAVEVAAPSKPAPKGRSRGGKTDGV